MKRHLSRICFMSATAASLFASSPSTAFAQPVVKGFKLHAPDASAASNDFIRLQRGVGREPLSLQTAIATFKPRAGYSPRRVDLVGAVHVGDKEYYEKLNKLFESYDVVLYELVAPKGTRIPKGGRKESGGNPISMLQGMTKDMLNLASQMDEVDYTRPNFVHADMSPAEMQDVMKERGDTPITVALSAMSEMMRQTNLRQQNAIDWNEPSPQEPSVNPLSMLFDPQRDTKLKLMMAKQFSAMGTDMMGPSVNQLLIADRNAAAMRVFQKELAKGPKSIAIFYGAAHLRDFENRLTKDYDLIREKTQWLTAWDLTKPSKNEDRKDDPLDSLLRTLLQPSQ